MHAYPRSPEVTHGVELVRRRSCGVALPWTFAALALLPLAAAEGQYFGKNKVIWERLDFEVLETDHFRIHYYPHGAAVADDLARLSERWYARHSMIFDHEFEEKKSLIIYQDHADFQQQVVSPGLIGEGTGGFTESLQDRVVLPLTGINADNDHVLGHELVHAFQFDTIQRPPTSGPQPQPQTVPLFLIEGLAEYLSEGRDDSHTAMWMRDAVLHDSLPDPRRLHRLRLSPYQYGQAVWAYVGGQWGDEAVIRLFNRVRAGGARAAFEAELGMAPEAFFEEFHASLRSTYQPILEQRQATDEIAEPLLDSEGTSGRLNLAPSLSPDGRWMAFLSSRELLSLDLFLADVQTGEVVRKLVAGEAQRHFDNLSFLDSSVAWSPDGRRLAFAVFERGEQRLVVFDVERGRVERRIAVAGVKGMRHPAWSPDGQHLAFSAVVDGASDLYMVALETNDVTRLTRDRYSAVQPAFSPDGRRLVFVTDRGLGTDLEALSFGELRLALLDLETRRIDGIAIFGRGKHIDPHFSPDGSSLYLIAEPDGIPDVFRYHLAEARVERLTALKTGVSGLTAKSPALTVAAATGTIAFSTLENGRWQIYRLDKDAALSLPLDIEPGMASLLPPWPPEAKDSTVQDYLERPDLGLPPAALFYPLEDYESQIELVYVGAATVGVGVGSYGVGASGTFSAYFSDPLGGHQVGATLYGGGTTDSTLGLGDTLGADVGYLNQTRRWLWGASASRIPYFSGATFLSRQLVEIDGTQVPADVIDEVLEIQTVSQASVAGAYPFSTYRRMEASIGATHVGFDRRRQRLIIPDTRPLLWEERDLAGPESITLREASLAYVVDTSQFGFVSPLRGTRFRLQGSWATGDLDFNTTLWDYRRYFFANPLTFAFRALHVARRGRDAEDPRLSRFDVGHSTLIRGYDGFDISECTRTPGSFGCPEFERLFGSRMGVLKLELRIPVLGTEDFGIFRAPAIPTEGVIFLDIGAAWNAGDSVDWRFDRHTTERVPVVSAGIAARFLIGGAFPIEVYYAKPYQRPRENAVFGFMISSGW